VSIPNKSFLITQCTVAFITALDPTKPAIDISTTDTLIVIGLDTAGGTIGWRLQTDAHELRGVRAKGATEAGIEIAGSGNRVSWNVVKKNGAGIVVSGSNNDLRGGTVERNTGNGVEFSATAQANVLLGANIQLNGGNGILIEGSGNTVRDNSRVDSNGKNGVLVTGSGNVIKNNVIGSDKKKGNGENGVNVTGAGNKLTSNKVSANLGDGFTISGGTAGNPNALKGNQSNRRRFRPEQGEPGRRVPVGQYRDELDGNKADGVSVPRAAKCPELPAEEPDEGTSRRRSSCE
jgi:parallel beta-helix repeat protein